MHFFGVRIGLFWLKLQGADPNNYYSNLTATRIKGIINIEDIDIFPAIKPNLAPIFGAQ
jgi:hypothetical protein